MMTQGRKLLQAVMDRAVERQEAAGLNMLLSENGRETAYLQSGYADVESGRPFDRDTIVRLYSMTKVVTGAAAMKLMEDGIIDLYEPVFRFIPSFRDQKCCRKDGNGLEAVNRPVQIRDLLNMTSGLAYPGTANDAERAADTLFGEMIGKLGMPEALSTEEFASRMGENPLLFQPGSFWQYGTSADVLGAVIEKVTDMPFSDYLEKIFFRPLGMADTAFAVPEAKRDRLASAYYCTDEPVWNRPEGWQMSVYRGCNLAIRNDGGRNPFESGGAGLFSTIDDMAQFANMLAMEGRAVSGEQILRPETVQFMRSRHQAGNCQKPFEDWTGLEGYSYGNLVRVLEDPGLNGMMGEKGEFGWDGWLGTYLSIAPESRRVILIMMQRVNCGTDHLSRRLRNIAFSFGQQNSAGSGRREGADDN